MNAYDLTTPQLIILMREALKPYGLYAQRDALTDIADLLEVAELRASDNRGLLRFWGLREDGTVMSRTNNFDGWEPLLIERYEIAFVLNEGWSICKLPNCTKAV